MPTVKHRNRLTRLLATFLLVTGLGLSAAVATASSAEEGPWKQMRDPANAGWSAAILAEARALAEELGSGAILLVDRGNVVVAWGDVTRPFKMASLRKSMVSALYGIAEARGTIDLTKTLGQLGIDDQAGLTGAEKQATVADLLRARSGVYLPAAYEPASMKRRRPERGSAEPGEHWFYNNWDFNVLGTIYEQETGTDLFAAFEQQLARPLGMEDFDRLRHGIAFLEPSSSDHPAHIFRLSARDLARVGQLYLQRGRWNGRQLIAQDWIVESTRAHTELPPGNPYGAGGYGYLWWSYPKREPANIPVESIDLWIARGNGGQVLAVAPEEDLVFVHCGDWYHDRGLDFRDAGRIFSKLLEARGAAETEQPELGPLHIQPFEHSLPAPELPEPVAISADELDGLAGTYVVSPELSFRVHLFQDRLFVQPLGAPMAELELFALSENRFYSPVFPLRVDIERDENGVGQAVAVQLGQRPMRAVRESQ